MSLTRYLVIGEPFALGASQLTITLSAITMVEGAKATAGINAFSNCRDSELMLRPNIFRA